MDVFTWLWLGWLTYFGALETVAIIRSVRAKTGRPRRPTRHPVRTPVAVVGTDKTTQPNSWTYTRRFALLAFLAWLTVHLLGGGQLV